MPGMFIPGTELLDETKRVPRLVPRKLLAAAAAAAALALRPRYFRPFDIFTSSFIGRSYRKDSTDRGDIVPRFSIVRQSPSSG